MQKTKTEGKKPIPRPIHTEMKLLTSTVYWRLTLNSNRLYDQRTVYFQMFSLQFTTHNPLVVCVCVQECCSTIQPVNLWIWL